MVKVKQARICDDMTKLINEIRARYILQGKRPPSSAQITNAIMKKYKCCKEELLYDKTIKL